MEENIKIVLEQNESLFLQCLSTTSLLAELSDNDFLSSEYFKKLKFANNSFKNILVKSGIGNPATMLMCLYALLVIPKEVLIGKEFSYLIDKNSELNKKINSLVEKISFSTYSHENEKTNINYIKHIRNAVAHCDCKFYCKDKEFYVEFSDDYSRDKSQSCNIVMKTQNVGKMMEILQETLLNYFDLKLKA